MAFLLACSATGFGRLNLLFGSIILYSVANLANGFVHDPLRLHHLPISRRVRPGRRARRQHHPRLRGPAHRPARLRHHDDLRHRRARRGRGGHDVASLSRWRTLYLYRRRIRPLSSRPAPPRARIAHVQNHGPAPIAPLSPRNCCSSSRRNASAAISAASSSVCPAGMSSGSSFFSAPSLPKPSACHARPIAAGTAVGRQLRRHLSVGDLLQRTVSANCSAPAKSSCSSSSSPRSLLVQRSSSSCPIPAPAEIYALMFFIGIAVGYWAVFVTVAAEHFGTNMRATVATTVPNFARGAVIPITMLFIFLKPHARHPATAGSPSAGSALAIALLGWFGLRETFPCPNAPTSNPSSSSAPARSSSARPANSITPASRPARRCARRATASSSSTPTRPRS
jgi:hypothetical protein